MEKSGGLFVGHWGCYQYIISTKKSADRGEREISCCHTPPWDPASDERSPPPPHLQNNAKMVFIYKDRKMIENPW